MDKSIVNNDIIKSLEGIMEELNNVDKIKLNDFNCSETILIIVDMINGFAKEGALSSPRIEKLINPIENLQRRFKENGIKIVAIRDAHNKNSLEFKAYPNHCIDGTYESEVVDEIKKNGIDTIFKKNSTNGFTSKEFNDFIETNKNKFKNYIIIGDCTDICIMQLALTLKAYFNEYDMDNRVIVPMKYADTFEFGVHNGELLNSMAFYMMKSSGVEVVEDIV